MNSIKKHEGILKELSWFSTSNFFRAKRFYSFVFGQFVPDGCGWKLENNSKMSLRAKKTASGKPALTHWVALHPDAPYFSILLCLMPDDFTRQGESAGA